MGDLGPPGRDTAWCSQPQSGDPCLRDGLRLTKFTKPTITMAFRFIFKKRRPTGPESFSLWAACSLPPGKHQWSSVQADPFFTCSWFSRWDHLFYHQLFWNLLWAHMLRFLFCGVLVLWNNPLPCGVVWGMVPRSGVGLTSVLCWAWPPGHAHRSHLRTDAGQVPAAVARLHHYSLVSDGLCSPQVFTFRRQFLEES